jgi:cytochrome c
MRLFTLLSLALLSSLPAAEPDSEVIASGFHDPMEISVAPDGDVYVIEREGRVLRVRPSTGGVFDLGTIAVTALREADPNTPWGREDGLLGLTLDPAFTTTKRLYLYYSDPVKLLNRLSRFSLKDGKLDPASEKMLLEIPTDRRDRVCHHGGSLTFGPGGLLYLSTGDNTNPFESDGYAPLDDREGRDHTNSMRSAGNSNDLRGKVLRIHPTEGGYDIPVGNLFPPGTAKTRPEIYAMGCRNPFRISVDPKNSTLYWGEVGPDAGENSARGPRGHDEVNQAKKAGNFGWPFVLADNKPYPITDFATGQPGTMTDPAAPKNPSTHNTGLVDLPPAVKAFIWYPYAASTEFPVMGSGGRNAMAGPVFYYDASRKWNLLDQADDHTLLTYDWMRSGIWKAKLGENEELVKLEPYVTGLRHPMDLETDAQGNLWLLEYGSEWYFNKDGAIRRLRPKSTDNSAPPQVTVAAVTGMKGQYAASVPENVTIQWWLTEGANERMIGTDKRITLAETKGSELRAVVTDHAGRTTVKAISLMETKSEPPLMVVMPAEPKSLGFGESLAFNIVNDPAPLAADTVIRSRYIPPTGHDAGGPQFTGDQEKLITSKQCLACHQIEKAPVGPRYLDVAMKYRDQPDALAVLTAKLKSGGAGVWGPVPMPPQAAVDPTEADTLIKAILGLADGINEVRGQLKGDLKLPPAPRAVQPGGAWEISVESPGFLPARMRLPAK